MFFLFIFFPFCSAAILYFAGICIAADKEFTLVVGCQQANNEVTLIFRLQKNMHLWLSN
jgi:hypothetical protein